MRGRLAIGFATTMFLWVVATELIDSGVFVTITDGGVIYGAAARVAPGGGVMASLEVAETPKSKEGMSGGGDDKGFDSSMVRLAFLGRSKSSGSFIS